MNSRTRRFFSYYKPYLHLFFADLLCAFVVALITLLLPLCARHITQHVLSGVSADSLVQIYAVGGLMLALVIMQTLCNMFVDYQGHMMGARMESDLRRDLFEHFQKLSFRFYDDHKTGQLMARITSDLFWLSEFYHHGPEDLLIALLKFIGVFIILLHIDLGLTLVVFLFLPVMALYAFYFNRRMNIALRRSHERVGDINAQVEDTLSGIRVVKSFANEAVETRKFTYENQRFLDCRRDGYRSEAYFSGGMNAFLQLMTIGVIVLGGAAIVSNTLDLADLLTYLLCVGILIEPIQRALNINRLMHDGVTGFNRFMEIMEVEPDIADTPGAVDLTDVRGQIEFRNVSFRYSEGQPFILNNLTLEIGVGEYVALVGPSGVGKTTLCSLIPRFYEVSDGAVLIDGHDVRDVTLRSLRRSIGVVQQNVYLFAGTVADNIRYGDPDASDADIIAAARKANAHDFIMGLPNGYDTDIGQRGVKLSGGQQQRLSIARVFLKDPPIIIFDEATSALDNESEKAVRESLEQLAYRRTTLVIAHRLSTVRNAQRIIVLSEGGIAEAGTHDELMTRGGSYAALYNVHLTL